MLFADIAAGGGEPPLGHLKEKYRKDVVASLLAAIERLPVKDKNLLRFHYLKQLTTIELGALLQVHSATISRWLARARRALLRETKRNLSKRLNLPLAEMESILQLVQSRLDLSLSSLL